MNQDESLVHAQQMTIAQVLRKNLLSNTKDLILNRNSKGELCMQVQNEDASESEDEEVLTLLQEQPEIERNESDELDFF